MKIYTRTGDAGETSLFGGRRVTKNDPRIEAYGTVDELNSFLGAARAAWPESPIDPELHSIQRDLFDIGAFLASPDGRLSSVNATRIEDLERSIDAMEAKLEPLKSFILPAGTEAAAALHVARAVCRRAERLVVSLEDENARTTLVYLNRLSDYLFVAARFANHAAKVRDVPWTK